ncbi:DUF6918 family protein [Williamsia sterculiae]|uniref:Uncharacterized protein n=1 Tax=Williamsia sterculiae TaxID=1344003 RepID=A0A1N7GXU6_9NOCA|nr:hypothetical protein [Williamsia sterculiae]SIS17382.1 hypothetical protein SAMN05445060_3252 [Williamsia sterculiae]
MPASLDVLLDPDRRPAVVKDLVGVIDAEVADKKGLSGTAVKGGYAAVNRVKRGIVPEATDRMLADFVEALEPFWATRPAGVAFGDHLHDEGDKAADALLSVTDRRASYAKPALTRAYNALRPKAKENVIAALPRLGAAIEKHAG